MDRIEFIEYQDLVPRQRTGPNFSARGGASPVRLLQEAFFLFVVDVSISVFREVSEDTMFPRLRCHFEKVPNPNPEKCVLVQALLLVQAILWESDYL